MQQQLDYIANAMHDTGLTPKVVLSNHIVPSLDIKYKYKDGKGVIYFHVNLHTLYVDDTIVTLVLPVVHHTMLQYYTDHSIRSGLLEKVSQRYFISIALESSLIDYQHISRIKEQKSPTILLLEGLNLTKIKWISFDSNPDTIATKEFLNFCGENIKERFPELEKIKINGAIKDEDCELLSKLISKGAFANMVITIILGSLDLHSPYLNSCGWHHSLNVTTEDGALKLINALKSKTDTMISLHSNSDKVSRNTWYELDKLNKLNERTLDIITKLATSLVKENITYESKEFEQIVKKEFLQITKEDILKMFLEFKSNPKIHKIISEKFPPDIKDNQKDVQKLIKTALTKASTYMINEYIFPDTEGIKDLAVLPSKIESLVRFRKLPLELKEKILQFAGSKIFSSCFSRKELQEINDLKEICILLNEIKAAATADDVQSNELLLSKFKSLPPELQNCVKDNIKFLFSGADAESLYYLLQSTVNEVEDLLSELQTTDGSAEAAIIVDSNNIMIGQLLEDLSLVDNDKNHDLI